MSEEDNNEGTQPLPERSFYSETEASQDEVSASHGEDCLGGGRVNSLNLRIPGEDQEQISPQQESNNTAMSLTDLIGSSGELGLDNNELRHFLNDNNNISHETAIRETFSNGEEYNDTMPPLPSFDLPRLYPLHPHEYQLSQTNVSTVESTEQEPELPTEDGEVEDSTATNHCKRTKTDRYHSEGRGPQKCKCGQPRRGHTCPFAPPSIEDCKRTRKELLAAFLHMSRIVRSSRSFDVLSAAAHAIENNKDVDERRDAISGSNKSKKDFRTKTSRYYGIGRGPQRCNRCGQPRKKHTCLFGSNLSQHELDDRILQAALIGLHVKIAGTLIQELPKALMFGFFIYHTYTCPSHFKNLSHRSNDDSRDSDCSGSDDNEVKDGDDGVESRAKKRRKK